MNQVATNANGDIQVWPSLNTSVGTCDSCGTDSVLVTTDRLCGTCFGNSVNERLKAQS